MTVQKTQDATRYETPKRQGEHGDQVMPDLRDLPADDLPEALSEALVGVQRLIRRRLRRTMPQPRLRGAHVELLRLVTADPGIRVSAAARELYLAGNSVSTMVNQLVTAGLLRRETDPADRRSALLHPTPEGVRRINAWRARRGELVREQVTRLSAADRAALAAAVPALRRLAENLHDDLEGAMDAPDALLEAADE
jgi:DNA-binding MarR family transcriptional regulator